MAIFHFWLKKPELNRTSVYLDKEILEPKVMKTMGMLPRHQLVP